jgi:Ca2+-binding RTX toxin-like protein
VGRALDSSRLRSLLAAAALVALAAIGAPKAEAVDVTVPPGAAVITLTDPSGVNNHVGVSKDNDGLHILITDTAAGIPGALPVGCTRTDANTIDCSSIGVTGVTALLGAGTDVLTPFSLGMPLPLTVDGGTGNDTIQGGPAADKLKGGTGNDTISAEAGRDLLFGQSGNDRLAGGRDSDTLSCGKGKHDKGVGGPAKDRFSGCEDQQR